MTHKSKLFFSLLLMSTVLFGFGCSGLSATQQASIQPITLQYWTVFDDVDQLRALAKSYNALHPYVTISVRQIRSEEYDTLFTNALADEVQPDLISMHTRFLRKYLTRLSPAPATVKVSNVTETGTIKKQTVVTTQENAMPGARIVASNFIKTVTDDAVIGGQVYGLPLSIDTMAIYYNKDLLDKAGIATPPTTWAELLAAVKKSTKIDSAGNIIQSGIAMGTGAKIENAPDILALLMMQNGVTMTQGQSVMFADGLDKNPETHPSREALRFYTDFAQPTKDAYSWNEKMGSALDAFTAGKTVFYIGYSYENPVIKARAPQMNMDIIPLPQLNTANPSNVANYWVESVVKKSKHPNEAWDFVRFMTLPENIQKYTDKTHRPTPLRAQIEAQKTDPIVGPFTLGLLTAQNWYRGRDMTVANQTMRDLITKFLVPYGETDVPTQRDANLIGNAASTLQQTM